MWALILLACIAGSPCHPIELLGLVKTEAMCEEMKDAQSKRLKAGQGLICVEHKIERPTEKT